jgi:hypothetical protein
MKAKPAAWVLGVGRFAPRATAEAPDVDAPLKARRA